MSIYGLIYTLSIIFHDYSQLGQKTPGDIFGQFANLETRAFNSEEFNVAEFEHYIKQELDVRYPRKLNSNER